MEKLDFSKGRHRPADYINICKTIADTYPLGIPHGVQKDGIQNAFHTASGILEVSFELIENEKGIFFTITDSNTKGLMGDVLAPTEYDSLSESDHWARFEGFGFTTPNPDAIGARGQGKFIFLAASKDHLIYYDSLRIDGTYRLGATQAQKTDCPMLHWDEDEGRDKLRDLTNLKPLTKSGTRIIIVNPIEELQEAIKNGDFISAIEETWFRAIEKNMVKIHVKAFGKDEIARVPGIFPIPSKDTDKIKVWIKNNDMIKLPSGERFRIKHLQIAYRKKGAGEIPEQLRGVNIIHYGMKITSINLEEAPVDITDRIYGFIEFDRELDRELRKNYNQNPNHYDLQWRRIIPKTIKEYILEELRQFGYKKLGLGMDPRERRRKIRTAAELDALKSLSKYAKDLDLFSRRKGSIVPPPPTHPPPPPNKIIGVMLHNFNFPEPTRTPRVNWGEKIEDFEVKVFNKTGDSFKCRLRIFVLFGDKEIMSIHDEKNINVTPYLKQMPFGPFTIIFLKDTFSDPGEYRLRIRLINEETSLEIDSLTKRIWVEKDPPFHLPFEVYQDDFTNKGPIAKRQWITQGTLENNPILYYNVAHPCYKKVEDDKDLLTDYLFEIFLEGSIDFILNRPVKEDGTLDYHPLNAEKIKRDPKDAYYEITSKIAEIKYKYYEGD